MLSFVFGIGLGFCGGVAAVLAVQAMAEHKSYHAVAAEDFASLKTDLRTGIDNLLAEIKKLAGSGTHS